MRGHIPRPPVMQKSKDFCTCRKRHDFQKKGLFEQMKKRTYSKCLYLTEEERIILEEKFRLSGMPDINTFIRHMIKYGFVFDVDYSELHENNYQIGKIGNNINQITHIANSTGTISQSQINEIKELMNKIWQLQESMLSKQPYRKP